VADLFLRLARQYGLLEIWIDRFKDLYCLLPKICSTFPSRQPIGSESSIKDLA